MSPTLSMFGLIKYTVVSIVCSLQPFSLSYSHIPLQFHVSDMLRSWTRLVHGVRSPVPSSGVQPCRSFYQSRRLLNQPSASAALASTSSSSTASAAAGPSFQLVPPSEYGHVLPVFHDLSIHSGRSLDFKVYAARDRVPLPSPSRAPIKERSFSSSMLSLVLPFSTSSALRARYQRWNTNELRFGKVLEDCDAIAADVAYGHTDGGIGPTGNKLQLVTAHANFMHFSLDQPWRVDRDFRLRSYLTWIGTSSMDIRIEAATILNPGEKVPLGTIPSQEQQSLANADITAGAGSGAAVGTSQFPVHSTKSTTRIRHSPDGRIELIHGYGMLSFFLLPKTNRLERTV
jgi:hypothetical protein